VTDYYQTQVQVTLQKGGPCFPTRPFAAIAESYSILRFDAYIPMKVSERFGPAAHVLDTTQSPGRGFLKLVKGENVNHPILLVADR